MPSYDFEVDLEALMQAARGTSETVQLFKDHDVEDLVPSEGVLGSATVWSAVTEFKDRWERGMNNLTDDVEELSGRLGQIAQNYAEFDQAGYEKLRGAAGEVGSVRVTGD